MLERKWNHIFYTGGSNVGRIVAAAAAKHLTPTVLELGGQAPAIVCKTANIDLAAKRIANFKIANLGQICESLPLSVQTRSDKYLPKRRQREPHLCRP